MIDMTYNQFLWSFTYESFHYHSMNPPGINFFIFFAPESYLHIMSFIMSFVHKLTDYFSVNSSYLTTIRDFKLIPYSWVCFPHILFPLGHMEDNTISHDSSSDKSVYTAEQLEKFSVWSQMYSKDIYARDRVMKSARLLLPFLKDNDLILDVGCFTQEAKKYYPPWVKYLGIDEKAYHKDTQVVNLNHGFEVIPCQHAICLETLEHLVDPEDCVESIYNSMPDNGMLVVSVPNEATLFHRLRCLCGTVDAGAFSGTGKHLHLPSLKQSRKFLSTRFEIVSEQYYISPSACNSSQEWVGRILSIIPDSVHQKLADVLPSLFARGFIFLLKKRTQVSPNPPPLGESLNLLLSSHH